MCVKPGFYIPLVVYTGLVSNPGMGHYAPFNLNNNPNLDTLRDLFLPPSLPVGIDRYLEGVRNP